jgi:hypothetical protein
MNNYSDNCYVVLLNRNTAAAIQVRICRNWSGARGAAEERAICKIRSAARRSETNIGIHHIDFMELKCVWISLHAPVAWDNTDTCSDDLYMLNLQSISIHSILRAPSPNSTKLLSVLDSVSLISSPSTKKCELGYARCISCEMRQRSSTELQTLAQLSVSYTAGLHVENVLSWSKSAHLQHSW